jgi:hypothetical protein
MSSPNCIPFLFGNRLSFFSADSRGILKNNNSILSGFLIFLSEAFAKRYLSPVRRFNADFLKQEMLNDGAQLIILQSIIGILSEGGSEIYEAVSKTIGWLDPTIIATFT